MKRLPDLIFEKSRAGKIGYSFRQPRFPGGEPRPAVAADKLHGGLHPDFPQLSEVEIVRHYTALAQLNYSVDEGFYPLGSCTMKYNPKINEKLAGLEGLQAHPYAPHDLVQGNLEIIRTLEEWLVPADRHGRFRPVAGGRRPRRIHRHADHPQVPGAAGRPPPAGADPRFGPRHQPRVGPFRRLSRSRKSPPTPKASSTSRPWSAYLDGEVAALMMTNPNTLGIFEKNIEAIAAALHRNGSLLYMDGANFNALLGVVRPGDLGVDVHAPQPAQNLLHPPWRRRPRFGPGRGGRQAAAPACPCPGCGGRSTLWW